jgi:aminoglycoside phosphotransferase (APT) family kinase protein
MLARWRDPSPETAPVRSGEEIDSQSLAGYLQGKIPGAEKGIAVEQFRSGHSNLTYLLRIGGEEYVLRRGPLGPVAPKAHDMAREFRVLQMVNPFFRHAPAAIHLCLDPSAIGSVFFLMERRRGMVLRDRIPPELERLVNHPRLVSETFVDGLVHLHSIDAFQSELVSLGKPEGFVQRQIEGWAERWNRANTEDDSTRRMNHVIRWLIASLPNSPSPTLVHNDYKLDNVMLRVSDTVAMEAVLDWEMATVGDPLADLGLTLCYWTWADRASRKRDQALTSLPGWYTRDDFVHRYSKQTGRDVSNIRFYEVLGVFKLAVILQQIYYRFRRGQTRDPRFENFGEDVRDLVELAFSMTGTTR